MEIVQPYQKKRAEFGRMCNFSDRPATLLADIVPDSGLMADYIRRDPCEVQIQNAFEFSEHEVKPAQHFLTQQTQLGNSFLAILFFFFSSFSLPACGAHCVAALH